MSTFRYRYEGIDPAEVDNRVESGAGSTLVYLTNSPWAEITITDNTREDDLDELMASFGFVPDATGPTVFTTGPTHVVGTESNILVNASGAPVTVTVPDPSTVVGSRLLIKKVDSSSNAVTVVSAVGTVEGSASQILATVDGTLNLLPDTTGSNWVMQDRPRAADVSFDDTLVGTGSNDVQGAISATYNNSVRPTRTYTAGAAITQNDLVTLDSAGDVVPASSSIAGGKWDVVGIAQASVLSGSPVDVITLDGSSASMRFGSAPAAASNGSRVFLSTSPGVATLTIASLGSQNVLFSVGILQGADGATTTPKVEFRARHVAHLP